MSLDTPSDEPSFDGMPQGAVPVSPPETPEVAAPAKDPNFKATEQYSSEGYEHFDLRHETALLPPASTSTTRAVMENLPQTPVGQDAKSQDWVGVVNGGLAATPFGEGLEDTTDREDAMFAQTVDSATGKLHGFAPKFKMREGVKPTGESARFHIRAAMGMGTVFAAPLWHSGFWVTLKAPPEAALLELYRQITAEKISLGRSTYGFMYSNGTAYTSRIMLDFIVDHLYESSLVLSDKDDIRNYIRVPDLQILIWAMANATWPNGFQYQRSCIADPEKCKHVIEEKLNLGKLLWTDTNALTESQVKHMTKRQRGSVSVEDVKRYTDEFVRGQDRKIQITDELSMILKVPTVVEHIEASYRWINTIEEMYARVLTQDDRARDEYLLNQGKATAMRQYTHFVKAVLVGDHEYDEVSTIEDTLNDLTSRDDVRAKFLEKAREYLDNSVISLVAIPTFKCPKCGGEQTGEAHKHHPELIPLDVMQTFFQLLVQRLRKIEDR